MNKEGIIGVGTFLALLILGFFVTNLVPDETRIIDKEKIMSTIDSVWSTSPGQENTLQTDYRYYGKTLNGQVVVSTGKAFHIGDTIVCIYYRYENSTTQKINKK